MRSKSEIAQLLRKLLEAVEDLSESDFDRLLNGTDHLKIAVTQSQRAKRKISESSQMSVDEMWTIISELRNCKTREEARERLHRDPRAALKENLTRIARLMKVHVNKHDRREALEDKIVESAIGVKLRSDAIMGLNLKGT
jgi:hypothetical protein